MRNSDRHQRRFIAVLPLALLAAAAAGCGRTVGGQVVAVVDDQDITRRELAAELPEAASSDATDDRTRTAAALQRIIERDLLVGYARTHGLDRGPDYVLRRRSLEQTLLAELAAARLVGTLPPPTADAVERFIRDHPWSFARRQRVTLDRIEVAASVAGDLRPLLAARAPLDAVAARLRASGRPFAHAVRIVDTASLTPDAARRIAAQAAGTPFALPGGARVLIGVIVARRATPTPAAESAAIASAAIARARRQASFAAAVARLRGTARISYDPAFEPAS